MNGDTDTAGQEHVRQILEATPDAIVVVDPAGTVVYANARTKALFGYERDEILSKPIEMLMPDRFRMRHGALRDAYVREPHVRPMGASVDLFARRKDGSEFNVEISLSPVRTQAGVLIAAAIRDVSERKALEKTARVLHTRLMNAVETVSDAFALFDSSDRLVLCNSACRRVFCEPIAGAVEGLSFEEMFDANLAHGVFDLGGEAASSLKARRLAYRADPRGAFDVRTHDGRSWRFTDRRTSEGGIVTTIWDLTDDVRRIDELREARNQADVANAAKSEFLSSMSHELRTPLNAVLGFAQLLEVDKRTPLSERQLGWLRHVIRGGEHLLRLIDDILDLSRIESGSVLLSPEPVELDSVLQEVTTTLEPMAARASIQIVADALPSDLPAVFGDRTRISQILLNYGSNAIKYGRAGGRVLVQTSVVERDSGKRVRIEVVDNGIGIPLDKQDKIFQPFHRAGQETGPIQGTGIGLTISKRIAEMMDGAVGFESEPDRGSMFWVELPAHLESLRSGAPRVERQTPRPVAPPDAERRTVLYVEDNPSNLALMTELMDAVAHVNLLSAPSAELGIELARAHKPDLIILDINLPGISGYEALRRLREMPETADTPVVALSASASDRDIKRAEQAGFTRYLTKPVRIDELTEILETLLDSAR